jgi:sterol desaturase/sphingolipid hydroxylase (fatty acid hydroxylase superfamily)
LPSSRLVLDTAAMRALVRWIVFPSTLALGLAATALALRRGVSPELAVLAVYFACMPLVALLERLLPWRREWNRSQGDSATDGLYLASTWGLGAVLGPLFAALSVAAGSALSRASGGGIWPLDWPLAAQVALACVVAEFFDYWGHRLLHESRVLWRCHTIHHSAPRVYWLNATRTHPAEILFRGLFGAIPLGALGVGPEAIAYWAVIGRVAGLYQHANVDFALGPLAWLFSIGELHRWHHARGFEAARCNYGNTFIVWDAVFGTRRLPRGEHSPAEVGIEGMEAFPRGWAAQLLAPLRWRAPLA